MRSKSRSCSAAVLVVLLGIIGTLPLFSQNGKLKVKVHPREAYVFVDGQAMGQASHKLELTPGNHRIDLVNYGYKTDTRDVTIAEGNTETIDATLTPLTDTVSGPWGCITIEKAPRDAVLLNGKTPDFFVGHGDEFNNEFWMKQELIVPPGTHQLTIIQKGKEVWTGPVEVPANQRVVIDIPKGVRKTVPWPRGERLSSLARFKAGIASATVAVVKPTAQLSSSTQQVNCGENAQLKWSTTDAPTVEITPLGSVKPSGEQSVPLTKTTAFEMKATGPGGTTTASRTVNVNTAIQASLTVSPAEIRYRRLGDKVLEQGSSGLSWSTSNASTVSIDPFGAVDPSGSKPLQVTPKKTDPGVIDETLTYTLTASNTCGTTETRTATLHITGEIKQEVVLSMRSVYFPTNLPTPRHMEKGLLESQQQTLKTLTADFKAYLDVHPETQLVLIGHADKRGSKHYNQALSERRAEAAKAFLVEQGVPAEKIQTKAFGKEQNLTREQVKELIATNAEATEEARKKALRRLPAMIYANNRRVDMQLSTTGQESVRTYPFAAGDFSKLMR